MGTITGSGSSRSTNPGTAAAEAVRRARERLGGKPASYGFVFASPERDLAATLTWAQEATPGASLIGCTTAGEITESGPSHGSTAVMLVASDDMVAFPAFAEGLKADPVGLAAKLTHEVPRQRKAAFARDFRHQTTIVLTDGLSGTGEKLIAELQDRAQGQAQIVGGAAGDEGKFKLTTVGTGERAATDAATALSVFGLHRWGVGVNHGLRPTTKQMRVTRATGNVIEELDGQVPFDVYRQHAAERGVSLRPETATNYLVANELGIHFFDRIARARAPLSVGADGSLTCGASVPKGSMVSILDGDPVSMVEAARTAAEEAKENLAGRPAAGVLLFDCVCRGMILKEAFRREVESVRQVFGDTPIAGFLTYGEIARYQGKLDGWHNATAVVVAIPG